jgi:general secretion pathway protein D
MLPPPSRILQMPRFRLTGGALMMTLAALSISLATIRAQSVSALAEKEARRRAILANKAIDDIQRGYELINQQKAEEALALFTASYESLPETPLTHEARLAAKNGYVVAGCMHARALQSKGAYKQAGDLLDNLLTISPKDFRVVELKQQFADPDRWPPALTEKHITDVHEVQKLLIKADSFRELGDYDSSIKTYEDVLRIDPANSAARRGMESAERARQSYFKAAYDHTRSKMLGAVDQKWEDPVPTTAQDVSVMFGAGAAALGNELGGREKITQKLRTLIFPQVDFAGATLDEVAELLRVRSRDLDPQGAGINFILNVPPESRNKPISLNLRDVPMEEVLRYVSEMSGVSYKVDEHAVTFVSLSERSGAIITRSFRVPPDFIQNAPAGDAGAAAPADPFGAQAPAGGGLVIRRMGAKEFLEARGVTFPEGASANFNSNTSTLTVRNTVANMEMVELFVEQASKAAPKMAVITVRMLEVNQTNLDELGFDWLLGGAGTNGNNVFFGGGSAGSGTPHLAGNYPFATTAATAPLVVTQPALPADPIGPPPQPAQAAAAVQVFPALTLNGAFAGPTPLGAASTLNGGGPVTSGLRSGTYATGINSIDSLLRSGSATGNFSVAPGVLSVAGVFTDPQFQTVIRALAQKKGIDINASPSVTTKNGLKATVEITREFIYPTEFDPPQLPQGSNTISLTGGSQQQMIATPTTPTAFEMRKTGVLVDVEPVISDDGRSIELTITPELTDFEGFVNYGSPIFAPGTQTIIPIQLGRIASRNIPLNLAGVAATTGYVPINQPEQLITPNYILQPIFKTQKVATSVKIWDGATVVLGGAKVQKRTMVDDRIPVLGDLPFVGRFFRSEVTQTETKNIIIFVTVDVIDPSGQKVNRDTAAVAR